MQNAYTIGLSIVVTSRVGGELSENVGVPTRCGSITCAIADIRL